MQPHEAFDSCIRSVAARRKDCRDTYLWLKNTAGLCENGGPHWKETEAALLKAAEHVKQAMLALDSLHGTIAAA